MNSNLRWQLIRTFLVLLTLVTDTIVHTTAFSLAFYFRFNEWHWITEFYGEYNEVILYSLLCFPVCLALAGNYKDNFFCRPNYLIELALKGAVLYIGLTLAAVYFFKWQHLARGNSVVYFVLILIMLTIDRWFIHGLKLIMARYLLYKPKVIVLLSGYESYRVIDDLLVNLYHKYEFIGCLQPENADEDDFDSRKSLFPGCVVYTLAELQVLLNQGAVDILMIPERESRKLKIQELCEKCREKSILVRFVIGRSHLMSASSFFQDILGYYFPPREKLPKRRMMHLLKRVMDVCLCVPMIVVLSPLFGICALMICITSRGGVFFRHQRVTRHGVPFKMYKFRTMYQGADQKLEKLRAKSEVDGPIFKMKKDPRITPVGRLLRRFSLDELPQLFNVLKGEMSLVGPRPPTPDEVDKYHIWHRQRLQVTQGLTGLWQISGRSLLTFNEMVALDIYYIENWSFFLDLEILLNTTYAVLFGRGSY